MWQTREPDGFDLDQIVAGMAAMSPDCGSQVTKHDNRFQSLAGVFTADPDG